MKHNGYLRCCVTFAEEEHRALAGSTLVAVDHPSAIAFPERFQVAEPSNRADREAHHRLLLAAQSRLEIQRPFANLWGVE
jgi:hypothetical protein